MAQISEEQFANLDPDQATELSVLVDLEACWENLRKASSPHLDTAPKLKDLTTKQKAYDAFHVRLVAYNKRYTPAHVSELLLNNPSRLGTWCRAMRNLFLPRQHDPQARCPLHLLEKAHRWADHIGLRMNKSVPSRTLPPVTIGDAIRGLEALVQWCEDLIHAAHSGVRLESPLPVPSNNLV